MLYAFIIVLGVCAAVALYFFTGFLLSFLWGWSPVIVGALLAVGLWFFVGGLAAGAVGLVSLFGAVVATDSWHGSPMYLEVLEKIEARFYLSD